MSMTPSKVVKKFFDSNSDPTFLKFFDPSPICNFLNLYNCNFDSDSSFLKTFDSDSVKSKKQLRLRLLPKARLRLRIPPHNPVANIQTTLPIHCPHCLPRVYTAYTGNLEVPIWHEFGPTPSLEWWPDFSAMDYFSCDTSAVNGVRIKVRFLGQKI